MNASSSLICLMEAKNAMKKTKKTCVGKGPDFNTALKMGLKNAEKAVPWPDGQVNWSIKSISGSSGGLFGFTEVVVELDVTYS